MVFRQAVSRQAVSKKIRQALEGYFFISPWIIGMLAFTIGPMFGAFWLSFQRWSIFGVPTAVGVEHYATLFGDDPRFYKALQVTFTYVLVATPLQLAVALGLAILLNQKVLGQGYFRTIFYLPTVVSGVALAVLWEWILHAEFGLINTALESIVGLSGPPWLSSETWALPALIFMSLWTVGGAMIIFLAGLQGIPAHLYEAAELDGAAELRKFWHITIPMLSPVILFNLIMGLIAGFQTFTQAFIMTNGGPNDATLFYIFYLYQSAFRDLRMGYASALAWIMFLIILVFTLIQFWLSRSWVYYEGGDA